NGTYGQAWSAPDGDHAVHVPYQNYFGKGRGTALVRCKMLAAAEQSGGYPLDIGYSGGKGLLIGMHSGGYVNGYLSNAQNMTAPTAVVPREVLVTFAISWNDDTITMYFNGAPTATRVSRIKGQLSFGTVVRLEATTGSRPMFVEGALLYDTCLTQEEILR